MWAPCGPSGMFSLISWLLITQFGHGTHQIEAEYLSFFNGVLYIIVDKKVENIRSKEYKHSHFLHSFFGIWISQLISCINFSNLVILDVITEGTVSQIFFVGPSSFI